MTLRFAIETWLLGWGEQGQRRMSEPTPTLRCDRCNQPLLTPMTDLAFWRPEVDGSATDIALLHRECAKGTLPRDLESCTVHMLLTRLRLSMTGESRPKVLPWIRVKRHRDEVARKARADRIRAQNGHADTEPAVSG